MRTYDDVKNDIMCGRDPESAFRDARIDTEIAIEMMEHIIYLESQEAAVRDLVRDCEAFADRVRAAGHKLVGYAPLASWSIEVDAPVDSRAILSLTIGLRPCLPPGYRLIVSRTAWDHVADVHIYRHSLEEE